jgi:hypothetical protein
VLAIVLACGEARGEASSVSAAQADAYFTQARALVAQGKYAEACPLFAESQQLDPGVGTLLNLAECYEKTGRTTSAWGKYREAAELAEHAGQLERVKFANLRASALALKVSKLTVRVSPEARATSGLEVSLDGDARAGAMWDVPVPVDPGRHVITATAPGRTPWSVTTQMAEGDTAAEVTVPALAVPVPVVESPPAPVYPFRTAGFITGAVGVAGIGVAAVFGILAIGNNRGFGSKCPGDVCPDAGTLHAAQSDLEAARTDTKIANVAIGAGLGLVLCGAVLVFMPGPNAGTTGSGATNVRLSPVSHGGGALLERTF